MKGKRVALLRLVLAGVVTMTLLPYAWARTLVMTMLNGRPELLFFAETVVGIAVVMALSWNLAPILASTRWHRIVLPALGVLWVAVNGTLVALFNSDILWWPWVVAFFVPATLWIPWLTWMYYRPWPMEARWIVFTVLVALIPVSHLLEVKGLTGEPRIEFALRFARKQPALFSQGEKAVVPAQGITLATENVTAYAQFLGPSRLGVVPNLYLDRDWQTHPPRELWRHPVGTGWGSFALVGDYAFTQEQRDEYECVVCYRITDGSTVWVHTDKASYTNSMGGPGPRATPTVAGGRIYSVGATGILNCLEGGTGKALWSVNILDDNQADNIEHGVCGSPLLLGDKVIVNPTGKNGVSLAAYDRDTGRRAWQGGQDQASYGSTVVAELGGMRQILLFNSFGVAGHDPENGNVLWRFPLSNDQRTNCSQPIPHAGGPDQVFAGTGYGGGCVLFRVGQVANGQWQAEPLWVKPFMRTKFTTAVLHNDHIYGLDDGVMECIDLNKSGIKPLWKGKRYNHGQVLLAGDLMIIQAENGDVVLFQPAPDAPHELGRVKALHGKTWNNPALAGRHLLVRNDVEAVCYELAATDSSAN
jgi:outer membrane protein assembly factor BamB